MKEKIRIFVCNKCCNTAYTTDVSIPGACTSQYWVRTSGICGGHYSEIEGAERAVLSMTTPHFDWVVNQEVEKRIAERMPSEEEINKQAEQAMQRDTKDGRIGIIIDSTYYGVFCDALEWLRSRLTSSEKPNNLTEGGE